MLSAALPVQAAAHSYQVQPGDTLWAISRRTGASLEELIRGNGLADPNRLLPGQVLVFPGSSPVCEEQYQVRQGDTMWGIARRLHQDPRHLLAVNHLPDPNRLHPGQDIKIAECPSPAPRPTGPSITRGEAVSILRAAAADQGLNPNFVLAVSYWESGWNQAAVSKDGAIGLMQVMPNTGAWAGPALLGHKVDIHDPRQNAEVGAALLRTYLDEFGDPKLALAAYYQGAMAVRKDGIYPSSRQYVNGIWHLRNRFQTGRIPPA